jgi:hypothetical protein
MCIISLLKREFLATISRSIGGRDDLMLSQNHAAALGPTVWGLGRWGEGGCISDLGVIISLKYI